MLYSLASLIIFADRDCFPGMIHKKKHLHPLLHSPEIFSSILSLYI